MDQQELWENNWGQGVHMELTEEIDKSDKVPYDKMEIFLNEAME